MKFLAFVLVFAACGSSTGKNDTAEKKPVNATEDIRVKLNESFEIKMDAVLGTGYSWNLPDSGYKKYLTLDTTYTTPGPSEKEGAPETQVFKFSGIAKGSTNLRFIYIQPWRKEAVPSKEKSYHVTVE